MTRASVEQLFFFFFFEFFRTAGRNGEKVLFLEGLCGFYYIFLRLLLNEHINERPIFFFFSKKARTSTNQYRMESKPAAVSLRVKCNGHSLPFEFPGDNKVRGKEKRVCVFSFSNALG